MQLITNAEIKQDIEDFELRIQAAQQKLSELPAGQLPYQEHKRREQQRRVYEDEIKHVKRLIGYAEEALTETEMD